jgi:hypothetical protein
MHRFKWEWDSLTTFNQFAASFVHPLRSKNVRSIDYALSREYASAQTLLLLATFADTCPWPPSRCWMPTSVRKISLLFYQPHTSYLQLFPYCSML